MVGSRIAVVLALLPQLTKNFFAINRLDAVGLDVIIAGIEHVANLGQFGEVSGHGVFDEIVRSATGCGGKFLEARFGFWRKSDEHPAESRDAVCDCQSHLGSFSNRRANYVSQTASLRAKNAIIKNIAGVRHGC